MTAAPGRTPRTLRGALLALALAPVAAAQADRPIGESDWSWGWWAEERVRVHSEKNKAFGNAPPRTNDFLLNRFRLFGTLEHRDGFRFGAELIDARITGNERPPLGIDRNDLDVRNLWLEVDTSEDSSVRVGRTDLQYGSQRLVSPLEWGNTRRTFEGVVAKTAFDGGTLDLFVTKPVVVDVHGPDDDDDSRWFSGLYSTWELGEGHGLDAYALALNERDDKLVSGTGRVGPLDLYTLGVRHHGRGDSGFDWDAEAAKQIGNSAGDRLSAAMVSIATGWTLEDVALQPRFGLTVDYASGDEDPTDSRNSTFNQLFPLGHKYLGLIDLVARSNIVDVQPNVSLALDERTTFRFEYHRFRLDERRDALRNAGGAVILQDATGASGDDVGEEFDFTITHSPEDWLLLDHVLLGYSHFVPGSYITDQRGNGRVDFLYLQLTKRF